MGNTFEEICREISSYGENHLLIGIDGRCASGKTTLANDLLERFDCNVFHTDDFFLPPHMRTEERFQKPGANLHYERLLNEVISPILSKQSCIKFGVFSCQKGEISHENTVFYKKINIIEGAYSLHPYFGDIYNIKIFVDCDMEKRISRIIARNGKNALPAFLDKWIPLEEAYLKEYSIQEKCDFNYQ